VSSLSLSPLVGRIQAEETDAPLRPASPSGPVRFTVALNGKHAAQIPVIQMVRLKKCLTASQRYETSFAGLLYLPIDTEANPQQQ
jgi:hypothetical protein